MEMLNKAQWRMYFLMNLKFLVVNKVLDVIIVVVSHLSLRVAENIAVPVSQVIWGQTWSLICKLGFLPAEYLSNTEALS